MKNSKIISLFILLITFTACEKNNDTINPGDNTMVSVAMADSKAGNFSVELMSKDTLFAGYNKLYFNRITSADEYDHDETCRSG